MAILVRVLFSMIPVFVRLGALYSVRVLSSERYSCAAANSRESSVVASTLH